MRKAKVILVAVMILLAGCSGGDGTATPTDTGDAGTDDGGMDGTMTPGDGGTATPTDTGDAGTDDGGMDGTMTPSDGGTESTPSDDSMTNGQPPSDFNLTRTINSSSQNSFSGNVELDMTIINGSEQADFISRNDTQSLLTRLSGPDAGTQAYYVSDNGAAYRNATSGETRYGPSDGALAAEASFTGLFAFVGFSYIGIMDWEFARTATVNGEEAFVYEADSVNRTRLEEDDIQSESEIQSASGEMTVTRNGVQSATVRINSPQGEVGVDLTITRGGITVEKPDWVDDSQFGS
jgi:hypothetical protein